MQPDHEVLLEVTPGMPLVLSSTSKGEAMKWYQPEHEIFIKANRFDHGRESQDSIAEVIASRLGALLHIPVLEYRLCRIRLEDGKTVLGSVSKNFCRPGESYISFETMVESADEPVQWGVSAKENYSLVLDWFKKMTGTTFAAYLNERRLATAAELLRTTDDTVLTIAGQVGFDNLSNFNSQFKARFGMTPRQYRAAG